MTARVYVVATAGPTRQHDAVRRRRNQADDADSCTDSANSFGWGPAGSTPKGSGARLPYGSGAGPMGSMTRADSTSDNGRLANWFSELGKVIGEGVSSTVAKVKEAANQPVLVMGPGPSGMFGAAAADAIVGSRRRASNPVLGRAPFEGGSGGASSSHGAAAAAAAAAVGKAKQGGKLD